MLLTAGDLENAARLEILVRQKCSSPFGNARWSLQRRQNSVRVASPLSTICLHRPRILSQKPSYPELIGFKAILPESESESELLYHWRFTADQFVLATSPLRPTTGMFIFQLNTCGYSPYVTSFWREDGPVVCICCWSSPAQSFSDPRPRDSWPYFTASILSLPQPGVPVPCICSPGWPGYTSRHWVHFSSPPTTRRSTVELFDPASTRDDPRPSPCLNNLLSSTEKFMRWRRAGENDLAKTGRKRSHLSDILLERTGNPRGTSDTVKFSYAEIQTDEWRSLPTIRPSPDWLSKCPELSRVLNQTLYQYKSAHCWQIECLVALGNVVFPCKLQQTRRLRWNRHPGSSGLYNSGYFQRSDQLSNISGGQSSASHRGGPGSSPRHGMWCLWWTKWLWGTFTLSTSIFPDNSHCTNCSTLIIIIIIIIYHPRLV
jgi:hypothetical protein